VHFFQDSADLLLKMAAVAVARVDPTAEPKPDASVAKMVECVARFKNVLRVLRATITAIGRESTGKMTPDTTFTWRDLVFKTTNAISAIERQIQASPQEVNPASTPMYELATNISWDVSGLVSEASPEIAQLPSTDTWALAIAFEAQTRTKFNTFRREKKGGQSFASSTYTARTPKPCSADFCQPGIMLHTSSTSENKYYDLALPFGAILDIVRGLVGDRAIPAGMGTTYLAAIVFSWYEIVMTMYDYYVAVQDWTSGQNLPALPELFAYFKEKISSEERREFVGSREWKFLMGRGLANAYSACSAYVDSCEHTSAKDLLGVSPEDFARNPGQIASILERTLGIKGLGLDSLRKIPGLDAFLNVLGSNNSAAPAA